MRRRRVRPLELLSALCLAAAAARAEQLPLKAYTTADGLPSDRIECILADSHGFLWFGTGDGLSRFDGYGFRNLGPSDGLPPGPVSALIESRDGTYWVGTAAGLVHLDASRQPARPGVSLRVLPVPGDERSNDVETLLENRAGVLWLGTLGGLFRVTRDAGDPKIERVPLDAPSLTDATTIFALVEDGDGNLWLGAETGLFRRSPGGHVERIADPGGLPTDVRCLVQDRSGALWVGSHSEGLFEVPPGEEQPPSPRRAYTRASGLAGDYVARLLETSDGKLWATCYGGVSEIAPDRASIRTYTATEGLTGLGMWSLGEDRNGNLWIGSGDAGVVRLAHGGFRRFDERDGLTSLRVGALFANRDGLPCALTRGQRPEDIAGADGFLECFDGRQFQTQRPRFPPGTSYGWGWAQLPLRDPGGEWWVPTFAGLFRFPATPFERLGETQALRHYTRRDGLSSDAIYRLFEDREGDLWIGLADRTLARWDRKADRFRSYSSADGIPTAYPMAFAQSADGAVWIGFFGGGLARHRDGRIALFGEKDGLPSGSIRALHVDREGRLWIATSRAGLARVDRPSDGVPRFTPLGPAQGLSSGNAWSLAEDRAGRIYAGTERGLDRIDPSSGNVQHYSTDDGLARGVIETSVTDGSGDLWFGSVEGLSRLTPAAESRTLPPPIRIAGVVVNGLSEPLPEIGAGAVRIPTRTAEPTSVEIRFVALDFALGGRPRYQYRVDGIDRDWSAPTAQTSVVYARLPSGRYRFRVRGISGAGLVGSSEAVVDFGVRPSFWKRPDVLAVAALMAIAIAYALHRSRLRHALAVERVRTRVATDLHDEVGSGLSEIAILSELANQGNGGGEPPTRILREIGDAARGLVDSMGDIVWSTDPRRDDVASLLQRLRQFAANTLESRGIAWSLEVAPEFEARRLDPDRRRQIFLILKEALTNVAKHAHCRNVRVRIQPGARDVAIEVEDDGVGFAPAAAEAGDGHGLTSMRARTLSAGGEFQLEASSGSGTRIRVRIPLSRSA